MGGHCMIAVAANEPHRFRQLTLFDPVIVDPIAVQMVTNVAEIEHPVARRRNVWDSPQEMIDEFRDRSPFSRWHADVLQDYCRYGLVRAGDVYQLACPPEVEAGIYTSSLNTNIYERIPFVECHVKVVRAESRGIQAARKDFSLSPTWPELAGQFVRGEDKYLPEYSHFMPMENPALVAAIIAAN
jgi:pimeloyl-ACP methyl ester carboxylesterase